jgi:hypothetical protein
MESRMATLLLALIAMAVTTPGQSFASSDGFKLVDIDGSIANPTRSSFFNFGHYPEPYPATAAEKPATERAGCLLQSVARTDVTWVQSYPLLHQRTGQTGWDTAESR